MQFLARHSFVVVVLLACGCTSELTGSGMDGSANADASGTRPEGGGTADTMPPLDLVSDQPPPADTPAAKPDGGNAQPSAGCGIAATSGFHCFEPSVAGSKRSWCISIPSSYVSTRPYSLVFGLHGCGGNNKNVHNHRLPMEQNGEADFLFAYPQAAASCWASSDLAFIEQVRDTIRAEFCVNLARTFVHGMSSGGGMSANMAAAGLAQAFASVAGGGGAAGVPAWYYAGTTDSYYDIISSAKESQRRANGCAETSKPIAGTPCVVYDGCKHPLTYCEDNRGHVWPNEDWCQGGILDFFRALP